MTLANGASLKPPQADSQAEARQQQRETIRGRSRTAGSDRIKLSRELMVRLSAALGNQRQATEAPNKRPEEEPTGATRMMARNVCRCASSQPNLGLAAASGSGGNAMPADSVGPVDGSGAHSVPKSSAVPWASLVGGSPAQQERKQKEVEEATEVAGPLLPLTENSLVPSSGFDGRWPLNICSTGNKQVAKGASSCGSRSSCSCGHNNKNSTATGAHVERSLVEIGCSGSSSSSSNPQESHLFTGACPHRNSLLLKLPLVVGVVTCARRFISPNRNRFKSSGFNNNDTLTSCSLESGGSLPAAEVSAHRSAASGGTTRRQARILGIHGLRVSGFAKSFSCPVVVGRGKVGARGGGGGGGSSKFAPATVESLRQQLASFRAELRQGRLGLQWAASTCKRRAISKRGLCSQLFRAQQGGRTRTRTKTRSGATLGPTSRCQRLKLSLRQNRSNKRKLSASEWEFGKENKSIWWTSEGGRKKIYSDDENGNDEKEAGSSFTSKEKKKKKPSVIHEEQQHLSPSSSSSQEPTKAATVCPSNQPSERVSQIINLSSCYAKQHKQQQQQQHQKSNQASRETSEPEVGSAPAAETKTKPRRKRKSRQELEAEQDRQTLAAIPPTTTTNCDTPECDSFRAAAAANGGKFQKLTTQTGTGTRTKWSNKTQQSERHLSKRLFILWPLVMLSIWLSVFGNGLNNRPALLQVSGLQVPFGGSGSGGVSDELSRAVLATMSTQSPNARGSGSSSNIGQDEQLASSVASGGGSSNKTALQPLVNSGGGSESQQHHHTITDLPDLEQPDVFERMLQFCRIFVMGAIIVGDICGNSLVILSVCRHSKLRVTTNWFVVSLACADILVALFAMTFNASVIISGRWLFKPWVCDFWNSCDVLASTASILHLCCISIDRYIAIMRPLDYPMKITTRRVVYALCGVWISSALLSYIPIFTGIYTTAEHIKWLQDNPDQCEFVVNRVYAIVSSSISFWIPCCIMVFTYYRIYREATRQEKFIYKAQSMMPAPMVNHHHHHHHGAGSNNNNNHHHQSNKNNRSKQRRSKSVAVPGSTGGGGGASARHRAACQQHHLKPAISTTTTIATTELNPGGSNRATGGPTGKQQLLLPVGEAQPVAAGRASSMVQLGNEGGELEPLAGSAGQPPPSPQQQPADSNNNNSRAMVAFDEEQKGEPQADGDEDGDEDDDPIDDSNSGQSTPTKRSISKMKREHKAAKTLGIIMGVFILCWLPFFSWYTPQHICGHACDGIVPRGAVTILFWIGYFNSTLNPIIYAYFNHEFRDAFKKTLQWLFCCCQDLKCLRVNRPNDNQHYNCTYRSTQEIGLVSNS